MTPGTPPVTLDEVDALLRQWRARLAAASRNVSELSELPEYSVVRQAVSGTGRLATEARNLVATMDELWQGVLLIGGVLDRAEQERERAKRLWGGENAAAKSMELLRGPSITIDLQDTPVLHRRLLGGARDTATVPPEVLLVTMDAAFDRAREVLERVTSASAGAVTLRARVAAALADLPDPSWAVRLAAADALDPLDRVDALETLVREADAAAKATTAARAGLASAWDALAQLEAAAARAEAAAEASRAAVDAPLPALDDTALRELAAWLDRLGRTLANGRPEACAVGLANWRALENRLAGETRVIEAATEAARARADELRGRLGALRAKHRARPSAALDVIEAAARTTFARTPLDLVTAARDLAAYEAALVRS